MKLPSVLMSGCVVAIVVFGLTALCEDAAPAPEPEAGDQVPFSGDDLVFLSGTQGRASTIVAFHKPSRCLIVYGHTAQGLRVLQVEKMDLALLVATRVGKLPYRSKGYESEDIRRTVQRLARKMKHSR